jgi:hypothetical protein
LTFVAEGEERGLRKEEGEEVREEIRGGGEGKKQNEVGRKNRQEKMETFLLYLRCG